MNNAKIYLTAEEVAKILGISKGHSYKLIRKMNKELEAKGFLFVAGKIPVAYFEERYYGFTA
ncbi:MAG: helix-turn-helix domain-containing protein [Acetatifactor sp.]|nr:helix-turn-helix domain-containing protein [Acetatifactor sp.]